MYLLKKVKKIINILVLVILCSVFLSPSNTFAANPEIIIQTEQDTFEIGDKFAVTFKINPADKSISSVDVIFNYNPEILEIIDNDLQTAGVQLNTSSSEFGTITKKIATPDNGEIKFTGSKIGGLSTEGNIFITIFKVLKAEDTKISIDKTVSKIFDINGSIDYDSTIKEITLSGPANTPEVPSNININISHVKPSNISANEDLSISANVSPSTQVNEARLYFKNSIDTSFSPIKMTLGENNIYTANIPANKVIIGDLQYFFGIISINEDPIRYPSDNTKYFNIEVALSKNTSPPPITKVDKSINQVQDEPIKSPEEHKNTGYQSYQNTSSTGPESIYIVLLISVFTVFIISKDKTKKQN